MDGVDQNCDGVDGPPGSDTDGDGIANGVDACPLQPGLAFPNPLGNGCPDFDGDLVPDPVDGCPTQAGVLPSGCPDGDGDGVPDSSDLCPAIPGVAPTGCPAGDQDGDGIGDALDACDTQPGAAHPNPAANGCPDFDADGQPDPIDACVTAPGIAYPSNPAGNGCPDADATGGPDGIPDVVDNCPANNNPTQQDTDGDGTGDTCDPLPTGCGSPEHTVNIPGGVEPPGTTDQTAAGPNFTPVECTDRNLNIYGDDNNNTLNGAGFNDDIYGGLGNDTLNGNAGDDRLDGGAGNDNLNGGTGTDTAVVQLIQPAENVTINLDLSGNGTVTGDPAGVGTDNLTSIERVESTGTAGNNVFNVTNPLTDVIDGAGGNDTLNVTLFGNTGGTANFTLVGGAGGANDVSGTLVGTDTFLNITTLNIRGTSSADVIQVTDAGNNDVNGLGGTDTYAIVTGNNADTAVNMNNGNGTAAGADVGTDTLTSIENVSTGAGNDTFNISDANNNTFDGGGNTNDTYNGTMVGTSGAVTINRTSPTAATVNGAGIGNDTLNNIENINIIGSAGNDSFTVNDTSSNTITGGGGTDSYAIPALSNNLTVDQINPPPGETVTITGAGFGTDTLIDIANITTSNGNDTFLFDTILPTDRTLDAGGNTAAGDLFQYDGANAVTFNIVNGTGTVTEGANSDNLANFENFTSAGGNDTFIIDDAANNLLDAAGGLLDTYDASSFATAGTDNITINVTGGTGTASGAPVGSDTLTGFEIFITGAGADIFRFDSIPNGGAIDGNGNTDLFEFLGGSNIAITHTTTSATTSNGTIFDGTNTANFNDIENFTTAAGTDSVDTTDTFGVANNFNAGAGIDSYTVNTASGAANVTVNLNNGTGTATGTNIGTDTLTGFENIATAGGNDTITLLTSTAGFSYGTISSGVGDDNIAITDSGDNVIDGGAGTNLLHIFVDSAAPTNNVVLVMAAGNGTASGDGVAVTNDTLTSINRVDITGTAGAETFNISDNTSQTITGLGGSDTYIATGATNAITVTLDTNNDGTIAGADTGTDTVDSIENVTTGTGNDTFNLLDAQGRNLVALAGTDTHVYTGTANVTVNSVGGNGTIQIGAGTDNFTGFENFTTGSGNDRFNMTDANNNVVNAGTGTDVANITMAATDDVEISRTGANVVVDDLTGTSTGTDNYNDVEFVNITGTAGNDNIFVNDTSINTVNGGAGTDSYIAAAPVGASPLGGAYDTPYNLAVTLNATNNGTVSEIGALGNFSTDTLNSVENVTTGSGNDTFSAATIAGRTFNADGTGVNADTDSYTYTGTADTFVTGALSNYTIEDTATTTTDTLQNFENITTSTGDDVFDFSDTAGRILDAGGNTAVGDAYLYSGNNVTFTIDNNVTVDDGFGFSDELRNFEDYGTAPGNVNSFFDIYLDQINEFYTLDARATTGNVTFRFFNSTFANPDVAAPFHGVEILVSEGAAVNSTLDFSSATIPHNVNVDLANTTDQQAIFGALSNFRLKLTAGFNVKNVIGTQQSDTILGNNLANNIDASGGNDLVRGSGGDDTLTGGAGVDTIDESTATAGVNINLTTNTATGTSIGNDTLSGLENIVGSNFDDTLIGSADANTIEGNGGNDTLEGRAGTDNLTGGAGNDTMYGGAGDDTLDGQEGVDTVFGGSNNEGVVDGNDTITDSGTSGGDTIYGGNRNTSTSGADGNDTISFTNGTAGRTVYGGNQNAAGTTGNDGTDTISDTSSAADVIYGGNNNVGGTGNDLGDAVTLSNVSGNGNTVYGDNSNAGAASGDGGADNIVVSESNNNTIYGGNNNLGGTGNTDLGDQITVDNANGNTVYGGNNNLAGTGNNDADDNILISNASTNNTVAGGNNNVGGAGTDAGDTILNSGAGNTTIYGGNTNASGAGICTGAACSDGADNITDVSGANDAIYGGNNNTNGVGNDAGDTIDVVGSNNTGIYGGNLNTGAGTGTDGGDSFNIVAGSNNVYGGNANNSGLCTGGACNDGADTLGVLGDNNTIAGGNNNTLGDGDDVGDQITLNSGGNTVSGGNINSGAGTGDDGSDVINNTIVGTTGNTIYGGNTNNSAVCGIGLTCDDAGDTITDTNANADTIFGGNNNIAGTGNNTGGDTITLNLDGTAGNTVAGGNNNAGGLGTDAGNDTITDNNGVSDTIFGGNVNQTVGCTAGTCSDTGNDTITLNENVGAGNNGNVVVAGNNNTGGSGDDTGNDVIIDLTNQIDQLYTGNTNAGAAAGNDTGDNQLNSTDTANDVYCVGHQGTNGTNTGTNTANVGAGDTEAPLCADS